MKAITTVKNGKHSFGIVGVTYGRIEIDESVVQVATSNPGIDLLALGFVLRAPVTRQRKALERQYRADKDLESGVMRTINDVLVAGNNLIGIYHRTQHEPTTKISHAEPQVADTDACRIDDQWH